MPHLQPAQIGEILDAFGTLPLQYDTPVRSAIMGGVSGAYLGLLPIGLPPAIQLMSDLNNMNGIDRLADGTVPLRTWLENAARLAGPTEAAKTFLKAYDNIGHRTSGAPRVAVAALHEVKEKIVNRDDMVTVGFVKSALDAAGAVAKLLVPRFEGGLKVGPTPVNYLGTGWLVTKDLLVTNHHVVNARNENEAAAGEADLQLQTKAMAVQFDFDGDGVAGTMQAALKLEAWQPLLDYAIVRIAATSRAPLQLSPQPLAMQGSDYPPVNIVQHPRGISKRYAIRNNLVSHIADDEIRYFTDTDSGSSGSPVFDDRWRVVALHRGHTFVDGVSFQGKTTAWVNLGTPVAAIIADLKARYPALAQELP